MDVFAGIDFGSRTSGNTVICAAIGGELRFFRSDKRDADAFVFDTLGALGATRAFIDAPLSLPGVYRGLVGYGDYHFRRCDRQLRAMSPLFLGGLTARAMELAVRLGQELPCAAVEVYPKALQRLLDLPELGEMRHLFPAIGSQHHLDALLAWLSGWRYLHNLHQVWGDPEEGLIIV